MADSPRTSTRTCQLSCDGRRENKRQTSRCLQSFCDKALVRCNQRLEPLQRCSKEVFHTEPRAGRTCRIATFEPGFSLHFAFCNNLYLHPFPPSPNRSSCSSANLPTSFSPNPGTRVKRRRISARYTYITLARNERRPPISKNTTNQKTRWSTTP